jgi:hypothetical protein
LKTGITTPSVLFFFLKIALALHFQLVPKFQNHEKWDTDLAPLATTGKARSH